MKTCPANGLVCKYTFCLPGVCSIQEVAKHQDITSCDNTTLVSKTPPQPVYTAEQMGEAYDAGWNRGVEAASHVMENKHLSDLEILERNIPMVYPDRSTYLSSLPKVKDAGVLERALERAINVIETECADDELISDLKSALTQYNNPAQENREP